MKMFLILLVAMITVANVDAQKKGEKTVVFNANLHCEMCKSKIEKNIPFEKGVKNLKVDMTNQTVTITFREDKNTIDNLRKAIEKLKIEVFKIDGKDFIRVKEGKASTGTCTKKDDCCQKEQK